MSFGATPVDGSSTPIPMSSAVPDGTNTPLAIEGGPSISTGGNSLVPVSMYVKDGNNLVEGATTDAAVTGDNNGSLSAKLRGLTKIFTDIWDSVNHRIKVDGSGVTQPVSGTVTANQGGTWTAATNADTTIGGTTAPGKEFTIGGKTNDATPQYQPLPEGPGGRSVIVEGVSGGQTVPVSGTVTANAGTNLNTSALALEAGGNLATLVPGVQGWIAAAGTGTAAQDDSLTFANQVRKVVLYNAASVPVPFEFDATSAATSIPIQPGQYMVFDNVFCTVVHVFPSATLPINTTAGLYVKGWK